VPPSIKPEDYMSDDAAGLSQVNITLLRLGAEKARLKEMCSLQVALPKLYGTLMMTISRESREELRNHGGFQVADLEQDANLLWTSGSRQDCHRQEHPRTKLAVLKQGNLSLVEFKKCYDEGTETLKASRIDVLDGENQAADFVAKLDTRRYGPMSDQLANNVTIGMAYPNSLRDAWRLANDWAGLSSYIKTSSDMSSVFVAEERGKGGRSKGRDSP
jgi:hypothetical protein